MDRSQLAPYAQLQGRQHASSHQQGPPHARSAHDFHASEYSPRVLGYQRSEMQMHAQPPPHPTFASAPYHHGPPAPPPSASRHHPSESTRRPRHEHSSHGREYAPAPYHAATAPLPGHPDGHQRPRSPPSYGSAFTGHESQDRRESWPHPPGHSFPPATLSHMPHWALEEPRLITRDRPEFRSPRRFATERQDDERVKEEPQSAGWWVPGSGDTREMSYEKTSPHKLAPSALDRDLETLHLYIAEMIQRIEPYVPSPDAPYRAPPPPSIQHRIARLSLLIQSSLVSLSPHVSPQLSSSFRVEPPQCRGNRFRPMRTSRGSGGGSRRYDRPDPHSYGREDSDMDGGPGRMTAAEMEMYEIRIRRDALIAKAQQASLQAQIHEQVQAHPHSHCRPPPPRRGGSDERPVSPNGPYVSIADRRISASGNLESGRYRTERSPPFSGSRHPQPAHRNSIIGTGQIVDSPPALEMSRSGPGSAGNGLGYDARRDSQGSGGGDAARPESSGAYDGPSAKRSHERYPSLSRTFSLSASLTPAARSPYHPPESGDGHRVPTVLPLPPPLSLTAIASGGTELPRLSSLPSLNDLAREMGSIKEQDDSPGSLRDGKCHSCGSESKGPWMRGPDGPDSLCEQCGMHYAKLRRKRTNSGDNMPTPQSPPSATKPAPVVNPVAV